MPAARSSTRSSSRVELLSLPPLRAYQEPVLLSTARDDLTVSAPQLGKTMTGAVWLLAAMWYGGASRQPWWWAGPTYEQAKHGYLTVADLARSAGILEGHTTTTPLHGQLTNGARFEGRSWDSPEGLYGPTIRGAVVDEFGQLTDLAYSALSSRRAETISRGEGMFRYLGNVGEIGGPAERLWEMAEAGESGFAARRWTWRDRAEAHPCACDVNGHTGEPIPPALETAGRHSELCPRGIYVRFIASEASRMSGPQFRQLYGAEWIDWNTLPVYSFDRQLHTSETVELQRVLPLEVSMDFNVDPMAWTVGQHHHERSWTADEIQIEGGATTEAACSEFIRRFPTAPAGVVIYGDAAGKARKTSASESDYQIILRRFRAHYGEKSVSFRVPESNPPVVDRVNAANARLLAADGTVRHLIHPRCKELVKDRARVSWRPGTREIDKRDRHRTHFSDSEDYRLASLFPLTGVSKIHSGTDFSRQGHESLIIDRRY